MGNELLLNCIKNVILLPQSCFSSNFHTSSFESTFFNTLVSRWTDVPSHFGQPPHRRFPTIWTYPSINNYLLYFPMRAKSKMWGNVLLVGLNFGIGFVQILKSGGIGVFQICWGWRPQFHYIETKTSRGLISSSWYLWLIKQVRKRQRKLLLPWKADLNFPYKMQSTKKKANLTQIVEKSIWW